MIYADLHLHTTYSDDSSITPKILLEKLVNHSFIKVAAVTDHDTTKGVSTICKLASACPDILIIPGVEISAPQGDLLVLGTEETPPRPWTVGDVVDFARENDYVSVVVHPYREYGMGDLAKNYRVDAIEVFNGASSSEANKKAQELMKLMGLPGVAGSDAHLPEELCTAYTEVDATMDVYEIMRAIKKGKVRASSVDKSIRF